MSGESTASARYSRESVSVGDCVATRHVLFFLPGCVSCACSSCLGSECPHRPCSIHPQTIRWKAGPVSLYSTMNIFSTSAETKCKRVYLYGARSIVALREAMHSRSLLFGRGPCFSLRGRDCCTCSLCCLDLGCPQTGVRVTLWCTFTYNGEPEIYCTVS